MSEKNQMSKNESYKPNQTEEWTNNHRYNRGIK